MANNAYEAKLAKVEQELAKWAGYSATEAKCHIRANAFLLFWWNPVSLLLLAVGAVLALALLIQGGPEQSAAALLGALWPFFALSGIGLVVACDSASARLCERDERFLNLCAGYPRLEEHRQAMSVSGRPLLKYDRMLAYMYDWLAAEAGVVKRARTA